MKWIVAAHNRTRLFVKVLIANGFIIVMGGTAGFYISHSGVNRPEPLGEVAFVVAGVIISLAVNFVLLRIAFHPLTEMQRVMEAIRSGQFTARSPIIAGDPDVTRLTETFNLMLDRLEEYRQSVSSRVLTALEEERKRIARELHDETSQALSSIIISLEMVEQGLPAGSQLRERARFAREYTIRTLEELRRLTHDLRPSILDDLGLVPALRWYLKHRLSPTGLEVWLEVDPGIEDVRLPEEVEVAVFRIVQEALTNVRRHARADRVLVRLAIQHGFLSARIEDNGRGFELSQVLNRDMRDRGLGLFGMQERAALVGGEVEIHSRARRGTVIEARVPWVTVSELSAPVPRTAGED